MSRQTTKWNPGDAANAFVRVILSDAGVKLGGLTEAEWKRTLDFFGGRCAYTGETLLDGRAERDHAIPMNRAHCGLHLYGNVVPATTEANRRKGAKHYRDFVEDADRLAQIETFLRQSAYWDRVSVFGDLHGYCDNQYRAIDALCRVSSQYLAGLLPEDFKDRAASHLEPPASSSPSRRQGDVLPIAFDPPSAEAFKEQLLRRQRASIVEVYRDGRRIERLWDASNMSDSSNVVGNLRSRPRYRQGVWQRKGIQSLIVSVRLP